MRTTPVILLASLALVSCGDAPDNRKTPTEVVNACQELLNYQARLAEGKAAELAPITSIDMDALAAARLEAARKTYGDDTIGVVRQGLFAAKATLWERGLPVNVCWENVEPTDPGAVRVKESIDRTWNSLFGTDVVRGHGLQFVGWEKCKEVETGIRITVNDEGPHVKGLGKQLSNMATGMVLNFDFKTWSTGCQWPEENRLNCIDWIAVHEFGHALGLAHEQNRADTPDKACAEKRQGSDGDLTLGAWDQYSIMNYCAPEWNSRGVPSAQDILGVRYLYAPVVGAEFCQTLVDTLDEQEAVFKNPGEVSQAVSDMFTELFSHGG